MELEGKVALVIGGSQGSGRAYVLALARAGARVVAAARTVTKPGDPRAEATLSGVVQEAADDGHRVLAFACDMEKDDDVRRLVEQVVANCGRVDVVVVNAGIYPRHDAMTMSAEDWDRTMRVNVRGPYFVIRAVAPQMIAQGGGSIITLTSLSAGKTERGAGGHSNLLVYGVSKAALNRLTTWFAEELRPHGIAVNAISPGAALTDNWRRVDPAGFEAALESGKGNAATPEVLGPPIVYLAQQTATTMTGQILHTNSFRKSWP